MKVLEQLVFVQISRHPNKGTERKMYVCARECAGNSPEVTLFLLGLVRIEWGDVEDVSSQNLLTGIHEGEICCTYLKYKL